MTKAELFDRMLRCPDCLGPLVIDPDHQGEQDEELPGYLCPECDVVYDFDFWVRPVQDSTPEACKIVTYLNGTVEEEH